MMPRISKIVLTVILLLMVIALVAAAIMLWMPGTSYNDQPPPMDEQQQQLGDRLEQDVRMLADTIGPRHVGAPQGLEQSVEFLEDELRQAGYEPARHSFKTRGVDVHNVEVELTGRTSPDEIVVIGAHYDSFLDTPAANDNASGVAANLHLARKFSGTEPDRTLRFVFFVNEENPWFQTEKMGSYQYAKRSRERSEDIVAMISLETIGYYSDEPGSQQFPVDMLEWIYGDRGDFIAFVSNFGSRGVLRESIGAFRDVAEVPSRGASLPEFVPGVGWSDQWAFWEHDYPGIMVTDTAPFRYPYYHTVDDTPEKIDYETMALVVEGLEAVVGGLAEVGSSPPGAYL